MSRTTIKKIFNCGNDHSQIESCHGNHILELQFCHSSDTVSVTVDGHLEVVFSDNGFAALMDAAKEYHES